MVDLGVSAPDFDLKNANPQEGGNQVSLDFVSANKGFVIMFICNHCPFVKTIEERLVNLVQEFQQKGMGFIGICSNDPETHPQDSFEAMTVMAQEKSYPFPYLQDLSQDVAKAYQAECTPDFFMFDSDRTLIYRGRLDDGTPNRSPQTQELRDALEEFISTGEISVDQIPSMGCNIKWRKPSVN